MQNFINTNRQEQAKEQAPARIQSFDEIYRFYTRSQAAAQAERCIQCGDPFCAALGCPLGNAIPQWLGAIAERDLKKAFLLSNETSPFPEVLGRICPHTHVCEGACTLNDGYGAITIGAIEASISDLGFAAGYELPFPGVTRPQKVAVVGSGPAGMSCAHFLLRAGIGVEMFERSSEPGGLLSLGIPNFKLDKQTVRRRFDILQKAGLKLHLEQEVGRDVNFSELTENFDAVFLGVGATGGRLPRLAHERHGSVFLAMEFLTEVQSRLLGRKMHRRFDVRGKRVVVVGGGDTAMDCVRTAIREGAETVTCVYRRDEANMPGSEKEYHNAVEEGVLFYFHRAPTKIIVDNDGRLTGVEVLQTCLADPGPDGRRQVKEVPCSEHCIVADTLILALGFDVEDFGFLHKAGIQTRHRRLFVDRDTGRTSHPKVFAGGDCHRGADLAVTAAADGRRAAFAIMEQLLSE
ncbi:glutamate synthase (NADPH) small subunit [Geoalkalibacter ferrihydriticus]|uniref:Glutamate synthase n=2 Tax=Geoalkalibacter ferrihydriticus TaxID=392333 RepID=A0A0C2EH39_9BACT|nr:glutamate synthase subunit beta [Geoalkalibacter ferrihydriticus]KIH77983.1 glutamate synthase [Geoalkalibacter ferrihydriticus DSM 17813]SDM34226.1 glutamate synthase (NADPH) small subunit [Geoalkalibacter ferrihydriticus]